MRTPEAPPPGALWGSADRAACGETDGSGIVAGDEARRKAWATWAARAALRGHQLRRLDDGRWLAIRNAWSRELEEAEVEAWLARVEGIAG